MKLTDVLYRLFLYFQNFQKDIMLKKEVISHELLTENGHVVSHSVPKINFLFRIFKQNL